VSLILIFAIVLLFAIAFLYDFMTWTVL